MTTATVTGAWLVADVGRRDRAGGVVTIVTQQTEDGTPRLVVTLAERLPDIPVRQLAHGLHQAVCALPRDPELMIGVTALGTDPVRRVLEPELTRARAVEWRAADEADDAAGRRRWRGPGYIRCYALDTGREIPSARTVRLTEAIPVMTSHLELGHLVIPESLPDRDRLQRALDAYDPVRRTTPEGHDAWGADPDEGMLAALVVGVQAAARTAVIRISSPARVSLTQVAGRAAARGYGRRIPGR